MTASMMSRIKLPAELWQMGAVELAKAIRSRQVSSREVVEAHLRRIEGVNPLVNAIPVVLPDQAIEAADAADRQQAGGGPLPPLHGVPFTVKFNIDLMGTPTTEGAATRAAAYPTCDAPAVERLKAAGAIPIGRTNLPTHGVGWLCRSELYGPTANPWDRSITPGASSGGEAVGLATGMSPLGLGNDGFGSLRWPAQCCGIASLRPTLGRIPRATSVEPLDVPISGQLLEVEGPMARRVADLRAAFEVLAGPSWRDPWSVPAPLRGPMVDRPVKVALVLDPAAIGVTGQVEGGLRKAAAALDDAGYVVEELEPPSVGLAAATALDMLASELGLALAVLPYPPETRQVLEAIVEVAGRPGQERAIMAYMARQSLLRAWGRFLEDYPLILAPISTDVPFAATKGLTVDEVAEIIRGLRMTIAVNALGLPAVALPVGVADGLPQAVQLLGARYREDTCLDAASAVEERVGPLTPIDPIV